MEDRDRVRLIRLSGIAGIVGAILWTTGDALIIGAKAAPADYPLLLKTYADSISFHGLSMMLPSSEPRLAAGALIADVGIVFYLAACWHVLEGLRPAGARWAWTAFALLVCGNAWSPLGHAAFYYVGMAYKTVLETPAEAHPAVLRLGEQFHDVLVIAWLLPIVTLAAGLLVLGTRIAMGGTAWPRWFALIANPFSLVGIGELIAYVSPEPVHTWLAGAAFNLGWLVIYAVSTVLLWDERRAISARAVIAQ